jgi:predicted glycosyl hydrolase (DUF1957 family)
MNYKELPENYKRSLTSVLFLIEDYVEDIYNELTQEKDRYLFQIEKDLDKAEIEEIIKVLNQIKKEILLLKQKYNLSPVKISFYQFINSKKSKIWEMLMDSKSERMKGYGKLEVDFIDEYDNDIVNLLNLVELLSYGKNTK